MLTEIEIVNLKDELNQIKELKIDVIVEPTYKGSAIVDTLTQSPTCIFDKIQEITNVCKKNNEYIDISFNVAGPNILNQSFSCIIDKIQEIVNVCEKYKIDIDICFNSDYIDSVLDHNYMFIVMDDDDDVLLSLLYEIIILKILKINLTIYDYIYRNLIKNIADNPIIEEELKLKHILIDYE